MAGGTIGIGVRVRVLEPKVEVRELLIAGCAMTNARGRRDRKSVV